MAFCYTNDAPLKAVGALSFYRMSAGFYSDYIKANINEIEWKECFINHEQGYYKGYKICGAQCRPTVEVVLEDKIPVFRNGIRRHKGSICSYEVCGLDTSYNVPEDDNFEVYFKVKY